MLDKNIEDLTVMADARRKFRQPLGDFFPFMLLLISGSRVVEDALQVIEALKLLNCTEPRASAGIQLEDGKRLFESILGRIGRANCLRI